MCPARRTGCCTRRRNPPASAEGGGDREGEDLVPADRHAHGRTDDFVRAHQRERPAHLALDHVARHEEQHRGNDHAHVEAPLVACEPRPRRCLADVGAQAARGAGEGFEPDGDRHSDQRECECDESQRMAVQLHDREGDDETEQAWDEAGRSEGDDAAARPCSRRSRWNRPRARGTPHARARSARHDRSRCSARPGRPRRPRRARAEAWRTATRFSGNSNNATATSAPTAHLTMRSGRFIRAPVPSFRTGPAAEVADDRRRRRRRRRSSGRGATGASGRREVLARRWRRGRHGAGGLLARSAP